MNVYRTIGPLVDYVYTGNQNLIVRLSVMRKTSLNHGQYVFVCVMMLQAINADIVNSPVIFHRIIDAF